MENKEKKTSTFRRILGDIVIASTVLLSIDVVAIMLHKISVVVLKDTYKTIFRYEIIALVVLLILSLDIRFGFFTRMKNKAVKVIGWILRIAVVLFSAVVIFFMGGVVFGSFYNTSAPVKHVIVLGMALENGKPTEDLKKRIDTAEKYLEKNKDAVLILTGGNPGEDGRTEAAVMRDLMIEDGVPTDRMLLEDQATTTKENFENTVKILDPAEPVLLISSNYHLQRAVKEAKRAGFENVLRLPAPSGFLSYGSNMMWEVLLEIRSLTQSH